MTSSILKSLEKGIVRLKKLLGFLGPGFLVTVGFIDPGNWATNIEGGSKFGYELLWVVTLGTMMLMVIQHMAARLGIATGKSLAVNIREFFPAQAVKFIGFTVIAACMATDIAELIGGGIGLKLLFGIPLWTGALLTTLLKVFLIVSQRYHRIEGLIVGFLGIIALCYLMELRLVDPEWQEVLPAMVVPTTDRHSIYAAIAILGAVVMPHNIFLHSNVIHTRTWGIDDTEKSRLLRYEKVDTLLAMTLGWIVNSAMIVVAASVFFRNHVVIENIEQASVTLTPVAGPFAALLFALALTFSGIGSSVTSSMAEANVITGFLGKPEDPGTLLYRVSVVVTAIPSLLLLFWNPDTFRILVFSQVVLCLQLPFTLVPLLLLCRNRTIMGRFRSGRWEFSTALAITTIVTLLNAYLVYTILTGES